MNFYPMTYQLFGNKFVTQEMKAVFDEPNYLQKILDKKWRWPKNSSLDLRSNIRPSGFATARISLDKKGVLI